MEKSNEEGYNAEKEEKPIRGCVSQHGHCCVWMIAWSYRAISLRGEMESIYSLAPVLLSQNFTPWSVNSPTLLGFACMGIEQVIMASPHYSIREALGGRWEAYDTGLWWGLLSCICGNVMSAQAALVTTVVPGIRERWVWEYGGGGRLIWKHS